MSVMPSFSDSHCSRRLASSLSLFFHLGLDVVQPRLHAFVVFIGQLPGGEFQLCQSALHRVDFFRHTVHFHCQSRGGFVDQVDGFVGQESVGDVAIGKFGSSDQGGVLDLHAVMGFVSLLQPTQNRNRVFDRWFADVDRLKTPFQRSIFFDVLAILIQSRGTDAMEFAAGQSRFEQVGGIAAAFRRTRADDGMQFVDEQNDLAGGFGDFL